MECPRCQHENGARARFCEQCAEPLSPQSCEACGAVVSPSAKFCPDCSHPVGQTPLATDLPQSPPPAAAGAKRRQLTAMFCDLVGSTALSARGNIAHSR